MSCSCCRVEELEIIIVSLYGAAWVLLAAAVLVLCCQVSTLRRKVKELASGPMMRVQRLTMDSNHAFHNPGLVPDEELTKRGYSMYVADEDLESGRGTARQTGGEFVEELSRELEQRQQRQSQNPPPFLLQAIQEQRRSRDLAQPYAGNQGNPAKRPSNNHPYNGNPLGNGNPLANGNLDYPVSYANFDGKGNRIIRQSSYPKTRQSDTNPNFIY